MKTTTRLLSILAGSLLAGTSALALQIEGVAYQAGSGATRDLSTSVDMAYAGGILTINLRSTSGSGSGDLLTGLGFVLPDGMVVQSGSIVSGSGSTAYGGNGTTLAPSGFNASGERGYRIDGTPFNGQKQGFRSDASANPSKVQTMAGGTSVASMGGGDFGLRCAALDRSVAIGLNSTQDGVVIRLALSGAYNGDLVDYINDHTVILAFASPAAAPPGAFPVQNVPEAGTTAGLLALGLAGLGFVRRTVRK